MLQLTISLATSTVQHVSTSHFIRPLQGWITKDKDTCGDAKPYLSV